MKKLGGFLLILSIIIGLFPQPAMASLSTDYEQKLSQYLIEISQERGFEVTKEDLVNILSNYDVKIEDFQKVEDLSDFLGEVIKADLSNLDYINETYHLDKQSLLQFLEENGEDINDYIYLQDIEAFILSTYNENTSELEDAIPADILPILEQLDITSEEILRISDYFMPLEEYFSSTETLDRLTDISNRLMAFEEVPETAELTETQIDELKSIYHEFLSIFKVDIGFQLIKNGSTTSISGLELLKIEDFTDTSLKVIIYGSESETLLDFVITSDLIDMLSSLQGKPIGDIIEDNPWLPIPSNNEAKTINGAKMPKTASNYIPNTILGLILVMAGLLIYRKVSHVESEKINHKTAI